MKASARIRWPDGDISVGDVHRTVCAAMARYLDSKRKQESVNLGENIHNPGLLLSLVSY